MVSPSHSRNYRVLEVQKEALPLFKMQEALIA
jgi:hypothetical protein